MTVSCTHWEKLNFKGWNKKKWPISEFLYIGPKWALEYSRNVRLADFYDTLIWHTFLGPKTIKIGQNRPKEV